MDDETASVDMMSCREEDEEPSSGSLEKEDIQKYLRRKTDYEMRLFVKSPDTIVANSSTNSNPNTTTDQDNSPKPDSEDTDDTQSQPKTTPVQSNHSNHSNVLRSKLHITKRLKQNKFRLPASAYPHLTLINGGKYSCKCGKEVWPPNRDKHKCNYSVVRQDKIKG